MTQKKVAEIWQPYLKLYVLIVTEGSVNCIPVPALPRFQPILGLYYKEKPAAIKTCAELCCKGAFAEVFADLIAFRVHAGRTGTHSFIYFVP